MSNELKNRIRTFTLQDVAQHNTPNSCWVTRDGKVYNVTTFVADHPGGEDLILDWAGKDITEVMADPLEHVHSDSAYDMLDSYVIGKLGTSEHIVDENWVATDDFHPEDTNLAKDFEKYQFLDLRKPLLWQIYTGNFSKSFYLQQVHQPRHLPYSARLFTYGFMEVLSLTAWWVVPTIWLPIAGFLFYRSIFQNSGIFAPLAHNPLEMPFGQITATGVFLTLVPFFLGNLLWTLLEYIFHRFLFHVDEYLPDRPFFLMIHFLLHGVHHYIPMDRFRLVMPPTLFFLLSFPFTRLAYKLFPVGFANGIISGAFTFYVLYDCMHYALHHTKLPQYMAEMKKYHLAHHYKNFELGFGVTSKVWDYVFNTVLQV